MTMRLDIVTNDSGDLVRREHARELGAGVLVSIYRLAKQAQMHDFGNQAFVRQLEQTTQSVHDYCLRAGSNVNVLFAQKAVFIAGQLLKGSRSVYEQALELGEILEWCGGSELVIMRDVTQDEMLAFAEAISQATRTAKNQFRSPTPKIRLRPVNDRARLRGLEIENLNPEQRTVRTYASAVVIMRRFFEDLQASKYILPRRIKRIAQSLVDLSEGRAAAFLGVTEARNANHDDAGKAVNSAILAVSMARELTEDRVTLAQIAMAAMMHDVARPRAMAVGAAPGMPTMPGVMSLSEEQEDRLAGGTAAVLTALGRVNEPSITRTVVAFEALWVRRQQWIGPLYRGARPPTLHSKIVAFARRYNDLVTPEPGLAPKTADFAVATLSEELKDPADKTVLRMLVAALGLVPVGTVVQLSSGEVCEVIPRSEPGPPDRPRLRVAVDARGGVVTNGVEIDLAREPKRRIARVMSIDGWKKGLEGHGAQGDASSMHDSSPPPAPSPAAVRPSEYSPSSAKGEGSAPSMSSISSAASVPSLGSSPSAVAEAMGKMINDALKASATSQSTPVSAQGFGGPRPVVAPQRVEVRAKSSPPPDDGRTMMSPSPFVLEREEVQAASARGPMVAPREDVRPEIEPTARGSLDATPLAHVLVYMLDHTLSGSVVFHTNDGDHVVYFLNGVPAKVRLANDAHLIGQELAELGALPPDRLDEIAEGAQRLDLLFGEYCVGHNLITRDVLVRALESQLIHKVATLANLPPETQYSYYRDVNYLESWGGDELTLTGFLNPILATVRVWHDRERVRATLGRIGKHALVFHDDADLETLRPTDAEQEVLDAIVTKQPSLPTLFQMGIGDHEAVSSVVYTLAVTRQFAFKGQKKGPMAARVAPARPVTLRPVGRPTGPGGVPPMRASQASLPAMRAPANERAAGQGRATGAHATSGSQFTTSSIRPSSAPPATPDAPLRSDVEDVLEGANRSPSAQAPAADDVSPEMADAERALEAMTNFRLAETALQRGDMAQAEKLAQKAAEGDPDQAEYVALHAWVKAMSAPPNQIGNSIEVLSTVLKRDATCERALLYRGKLYKRANKTKEALKDFEAVLKVNPKHREAASEVRLLKMHAK